MCINGIYIDSNMKVILCDTDQCNLLPRSSLILSPKVHILFQNNDLGIQFILKTFAQKRISSQNATNFYY